MTAWFKPDGTLNVEPGEKVALNTSMWKPFYAENIDVEPVLIESKSQYKEELRKRNLKCRGLE
jgi:hypothetical protein